MSSIFAESLRRSVEKADNATLVSLLEPRVQEGIASESESLLCGVLLLMPPFADYLAAARIFSGLFKGNRSLEAAVWDAYRFAVLLPDGDQSFEVVLHSTAPSAVGAHMLSMVAAARNDVALALSENRRSRDLRFFPFNIVEALKLDPSLEASTKRELWRIACDLIVSRTAEADAPVFTVEGMLQRHWDNLILGTRITSQLWQHYSTGLGKQYASSSSD